MTQSPTHGFWKWIINLNEFWRERAQLIGRLLPHCLFLGKRERKRKLSSKCQAFYRWIPCTTVSDIFEDTPHASKALIHSSIELTIKCWYLYWGCSLRHGNSAMPEYDDSFDKCTSNSVFSLQPWYWMNQKTQKIDRRNFNMQGKLFKLLFESLWRSPGTQSHTFCCASHFLRNYLAFCSIPVSF